MSKFLKSFLLLVTAGLFTATSWAAGESISIGFNHTRTDDSSKFTGETLYGWTGAQVAGDNWNHIEKANNDALSNVSVTGLKLNSGEKVTATIKNLSTQGSWKHYGPEQMNGGTRDYYDGQITFTLEDIPFSEYSVVLFMATNDGGKTWGAVKVTSDAEDEGKYYTYVDGVLSAEGTAESTWGNSSSLTENYTATEGTNVMVIPNLSGDKTFLTYGTSGGAATRGGLYAIQIINTGALTIPEPMWTWDGTKADGSMCTQLDRLPFGVSYTVSNRIFDLNDLNIPAKNFTYSFWTMREGAGNWKNYAGFSNSSGVLQVQRDASGSTVHIYMAGGPSLASGEMYFPLASNTYELVTCVQDSASFKVYVNGELKATETLNNWSSLSDASATMRWFALGSAPNVSGASFEDRNSDARVADARIYGVALSAEQVQMLYKASIANMPEVIQNATAHYEFEGTAYGLRGNLSLTSEAPSASDCVETLRKYPEGVASAGEFYKGVKIRSGVSPHNNYQWPDEFTVAAYVNVTDCPDNGTICSFRDSYWLQKVSATEIRFGKNNDEESVKASLADLSLGYHLVVVTKTADTITIQIDNNEPVNKAVALNSPNGIQLGTGWASSAARATGMILDGFAIWNKVLSSEEVTELSTYYPELYPALSMAADTDASDALSWDEITAVVKTRTTWDVSGEVTIALDADVDPALTALTLRPANASGDSLTITGTGSLYGGNFTLTTAIPVDITNQKNNPTITLSGIGDVTIRKPATNGGGIAPAFNNYTGTLTVDDGQQITRMGGDLTIPFTVGENGAKLHSNDGNWTVSSKISGSGTLTVVSPNRWISVTNNTNDFTGNVVVESGTLYVGNKGSENSGSDAKLGDATSTYTVKSGATFYTHLGGDGKTFAPNITLEDGAIFGNRDGHVTYNGNITINGNVSYNFYWNKQNTFAGVVAGTGILTINGPDNENGTCEIRLTNAGNTFSGTYKLAGKNANRKIKLVACATESAPAYNLTNAHAILSVAGDITASALTGAAGTIESSAAGTARTVTLTGNSDVRSLSVSNDITFAVTAGETYITSTTKATVATDAKVKVVLTADQKLTGLTLGNVTVNDGGTVVFLDIDGTTELQSANSNEYAGAQECTYTVAEEGGAWNKNPEMGDAITLAFGEITDRTLDASILPQGVTSLAKITITGANASVAASLVAYADTIESATAWSLVGTEQETTIAGIISGEGQVKIAAGLVKFTNTNIYTGGTDIAADATLVMGNANAIGTTGNITGAGTLKFSGFVPANLSNLTANDGGWTGTFYMMNRPSSGTFPVNDWGNANSTVCLENCSGYLTPAGGTTVVPNIRVEGEGWRSQNGDGNAQFTFTGALSGSGKLEVATGTPSAGNFYKFTGDVSKFAGYVNVTNNHRVVFGNADSQGNGKITIATDMTIAANMTWSAVNGIAIMEGATLTVNGALTGAIANEGVLVYAVDTTASNTFTGAGFIVANGEGVELDLRTATWTDFNGALNAINGATIKLPYAATAGKTLSFDETSTFVVVYSDAETEQDDLNAITVTGRGTLQFVDAAGNALPSSGSTYVPSVYTVTDEGGSWNVAPLQNNKITIDFAETEGETVDLAAILGDVTTLSKLTIKGTNGGTITNSAVTACPIVEVLASGRTEVPAALTSLATTVTGPTAEGSLLYVTGETTATTSRYPYTGNRHFETLKFTGAKTIGQGIDTYEVATGEKIEFHYNDGACYETSLSVNGGEIRTMQNTYVWLAGIANKTFTLKAGTADFSNVTVDDGTQGLLIGYQQETHTFDIQGGELNAPNTSIVAWETDCRFIQSGGTVKTKGFRQRSDNNNRFTVMTLTGGTIELGAGGIPNLSMESISFGGATIHAVENNTIAETLNMTATSTLSAAAEKTMTVTSSITGEATLVIDGAGTVDLSRATIANTIALDVKAGATVVVAANQVSSFAKVTVAETATLKITGVTADSLLVGRLNCTLGAESAINGTVILDGVDGTTATVADGVLSVTFEANPALIGSAWWWDYEFNGNVNSIGSDTAPLVLEGDGTTYVTVAGDNQALYFQKTPYRNNGNDVKARFAEVDAFTAVMYCQPGAYDNVPLVGFGSTTQDDKVAVVLATGAKAANGEMAILLVKGNNHVVTHLADNLVVPNATTAYHLYAFTFEAQETQTVISVYVDGKLKKTTIVNERFRVSNGFQIGSLHGGVMTAQTGLSKYSASGDSGTIDFLRVTKGVLSAEAMRKMAEVYKYESENGEATRTIEEETANWVVESTWTQSGEDAPVNQPNNGTNVTLTANVETEVTVNLTEAVTYETVTVAGNTAVTFKKGTAAFSAGDITIGTDVTIEYGAINVGTLIVNGGKTLTFDFTDYDFNSIYASKTLPLTGLATLGENATVTVALPTLPAYLTVECVFDANKSEYALAITVTGTLAATIQDNAITWKVGDTVVTPPADLTALESITMTVVGDNSVTLPEMTLASVVLTGEGNAVTFESGKLTVNNTLTMNNVNVKATPETLIAAVVTGTAGTETFTMHSQASYNHEQAFAMRFERCALTKTGSGTVPIAVNGIELDTVNVTLVNGALQLASRGGDPQIKDTSFTYVDANEDGVADGELTNYGWIHSTTTTTFIVPEGVTGRAVVGSCLTNTGAVVKQGAGTLVLGIMKTNNANPYTGATTVEAGTLAYHITNSSSSAFVMNSVITVEAGAAIKGVENCTLASLTFEAGAIVDATDAPVVVTDVTLPEGEGKVSVRMTRHGEVLKATDITLEKFTIEQSVEGWNLVVTEDALLYVAAPATGDVEFSAEVQEMLNAMAQAAAEHEGITSLTIEGITLSADGEKVVKADIAGLELFERVPVLVVPDGENGTGVAMVNYVFGISDITVNGDGCIVVKASVDRLAMDNPVEPIEGEDAGEGEGEMPELPRPTFVNGVAVELLNGGTPIGTATVNVANASEITITSTQTVAEIFNGAVGTLDLTVKVKTPTQAAEPETPAEPTPAE